VGGSLGEAHHTNFGNVLIVNNIQYTIICGENGARTTLGTRLTPRKQKEHTFYCRNFRRTTCVAGVTQLSSQVILNIRLNILCVTSNKYFASSRVHTFHMMINLYDMFCPIVFVRRERYVKLFNYFVLQV
jgi:hypothetical protein